MKTIEFGAKNPELNGWEYTIPEGMEATVENGKIILRERESEDERIMRCIEVALTDVDEQRFKDFGTTLKECLAYLEKQKDASKAIEAVERIDKYIDEHLANAHDMKDSNPDKEYYRGWDDALGKMAGILQDVYSWEKKKESLRDFIDNFPYSDEQKEQKPAEWSEDEKKLLDTVEVLLDNHYDYLEAESSEYIPEVRETINRLKSLRPQPKAELTLLDENIIKAAVAFVEQNDHFNCWDGIDKHTVIKALRSLKHKVQEEPLTDAELGEAMSELTEFKKCATRLADTYGISYKRDIDWHNFCAGVMAYLKKYISPRSRPEKSDNWRPDEYDFDSLSRLKNYMPDNEWGGQMYGFIEDLIDNLKKL